MLAKTALEERESDLSASLRIRIARTFSNQFNHFVERAAKDLLKSGLGSFSTEDEANLDRREVAALMKAREICTYFQHTFAFFPPQIAQKFDFAPPCNPVRHEKCIAEWNAMWVERVPPRLLHPVYPMDPLDISFYLERLEAEYKSVLPQCLKNAFEALEKAEFDKDAPLGFEQRALQGLVCSIQEHHRKVYHSAY